MKRSASPSKELLRRIGRAFATAERRATPKAVHKLRTTACRAEVLLAASSLPEKQLQKTAKLLRKIRRRAGKVRDLDVQTAALESMNIRREGKLKTEVLQELQESRHKREKKLLGALHSNLPSRLRKRVAALEADGGLSNDISAAPYALEQLGSLQQHWSGQRPESIDELHVFRLEAKRVRYALELAKADVQAHHYITILKSMQDAIGEAHDWAVLSDTVAKQAAPASPLQAAIRATSAAKLRDARRSIAFGMEQLSNAVPTKRAPQAAAALPSEKSRHQIA